MLGVGGVSHPLIVYKCNHFVQEAWYNDMGHIGTCLNKSCGGGVASPSGSNKIAARHIVWAAFIWLC